MADETEIIWFDPVNVIDTVSTALVNLNASDLTEKQIADIKEDFTAILYQCSKMVLRTLKEQNDLLYPLDETE